MRAYLAVSFADLPNLVGTSDLGDRTAYAVTDQLRDALVGEDDELLEEEARARAAERAIDVARATGQTRRAVLTIEVPAAVVAEPRELDREPDIAEIRLTAAVSWRAVVAVHVDEPKPTEPWDEAEMMWFLPGEIPYLDL